MGIERRLFVNRNIFENLLSRPFWVDLVLWEVWSKAHNCTQYIRLGIQVLGIVIDPVYIKLYDLISMKSSSQWLASHI